MTVEIKLTKGYVAIVDDEDADLAAFTWTPRQNKGETKVYAIRNDGKTSYLHRVILSRKLGRALEKHERCDHIKNDGLDCRRENLRIATQRQNMQNRNVHKSKGKRLKGTYAYRGKWQTLIHIDGKSKYLGLYDTELKGHEVYCRAAFQHFGEFANFGDNSPFTPADFMEQPKAA